MAAFLQTIILGRKRKTQNDLQYFRRQSKARLNANSGRVSRPDEILVKLSRPF